MGYRINLNIVDKSDFESVAEFNYDTIYDLIDRKKTRIELWNELNLDLFDKTEGEFDEYHPRILNKSDIREILKVYQKLLVESSEERMKKQEYSITFDHYIKCYFDQLIDTDSTKVKGSGLFLLDYFYLVEIYDRFSDESDVCIITHG